MIVILGTLDTKGDKIAYIKQLLEARGAKTLVIDGGVLGTPLFEADIPREEVIRSTGRSLEEIGSLGEEAEAIRVMAEGASRIVADLYSSGELEGIIGVGGTMGTSLFLAVTAVLPVGIPKVIFSTTAFTSHLRPELVPPDLIVIPAVSDVWGLSSLARRMLENAAGAVWGAARMYREGEDLRGKTFLGITTLGITALRYVQWLTPSLEEMGYQVIMFHVGGGQGWPFEQLVGQDIISGVLDLSLIDLCPGSVAGRGFLSVPGRLETAGRKGIPQVIAPGGVDFFTWPGPLEAMPKDFRGRRKHQHNELAWAVERSLDEVARTAELVAARLSKGQGPRAIVIPQLGFSEWDKPGGAFYDPERSRVFTHALRAQLSPEVKLVELKTHINDPAFAAEAARIFSSLSPSQRPRS